MESLTQEQRVVTAEPLSVTAVDAGVFAVSFDVRSGTGIGGPPTEGETRTLMITVDGLQLVSDVR